MAEIDKGLPNTRNIKIDSFRRRNRRCCCSGGTQDPGPIEVIPEEDGGVTLDFEPGAINIPGTESHFDNLAEFYQMMF